MSTGTEVRVGVEEGKEVEVEVKAERHCRKEGCGGRRKVRVKG